VADSASKPFVADSSNLEAVDRRFLFEAASSGLQGHKEGIVFPITSPGSDRYYNSKLKLFFVSRVDDDDRTFFFDLISDRWVQIHPVDFTGFQNRPLL